MDIAGIIPTLTSQGGGEKYFVRTFELLQKNHDIFLYTMKYDKNVFPSLKKNIIELGKPWILKGIFKEHNQSALLKSIGMKFLEKKIPTTHDIYNFHIFPTNLINRKPSVYTCQEPPRMLYDLKEQFFEGRNNYFKIISKTYFPFLKPSKGTQK